MTTLARAIFDDLMVFVEGKFNADELSDVALRIAEGLAYNQIFIVYEGRKIRGLITWWQTDERKPDYRNPPDIKTGGIYRHYSAFATDGTREVMAVMKDLIKCFPGTWHRKKYNGRLFGGGKCLKNS